MGLSISRFELNIELLEDIISIQYLVAPDTSYPLYKVLLDLSIQALPRQDLQPDASRSTMHRRAQV
jgi:hypothetical protein